MSGDKKIVCEICGREFAIDGFAKHLKDSHKFDSEKYYLKYIGEQENCVVCGKRVKIQRNLSWV